MNPAKCLLVDDREENLVALGGLLEDEPLEIFTARSGAEALNLLLEHEFALAMIDVHMPHMDGFELAELMRGTQRTRGIPIIFVTASGPDQGRAFKGYEAGAVDFLFKPLHAPVVQSKVRVFVDLHRQREALKAQVAALQESQELTRQAVEARNRFISIASHELRTPLTVLRLQLSMARRRASRDPRALAPDQAGQLLDQLERQVDRLVPLVEEMLDVTRIQSGKLRIRRERFDLAALATEVARQFAPVMGEAGCQVQVDCQGEAVGEWDRFRLEQVISNLLSNAARHGGGGLVRVAVRGEAGAVELRVSDQGRGIPPEDRERIFQPFEQSSDSSAKVGLGLGLHIVRQIVEMHGGRIWVESAPGQGATFIVRLPLSAQLAPAARAC